MRSALQFICRKCRGLSGVGKLEQTRDGIFYACCEHCDAKNGLVQTGATPSQPGLLPVTQLIQ
jgi:hypothetical protein